MRFFVALLLLAILGPPPRPADVPTGARGAAPPPGLVHGRPESVDKAAIDDWEGSVVR